MNDADRPAVQADPGAPDAEGLPRDRPRGIGRRILSGALSYGVVIAIFWFLYAQLQGSDSLADSFEQITETQVVVICVLGLVNLATNWPPIVITLRGLRLREAAVTNAASAALSNTVPEGGAIATGLNFAMMRSWGFDLDAITSSFLTTGLWTNLVRYSLVSVGLLVMAATEDVAVAVVGIAVVVAVLVVAAIGLLALVLRTERFARGLGRVLARIVNPVLALVRKPRIENLDDRVADFRLQLIGMLRTQWHALTAAMLVSQLTTCVVLGVAVRMQGLDGATVSWSRIVVAYGGMTLASLVAPTPGGLGVAEVTLVAILGAALPETAQNQVVAAVILFRIATWLVPIPIGAGSYLFWRKDSRWRMTPEERAARLVAAPGSRAWPTA